MEINTQLGKYKLTEKLGKGGMAEVFKAFQSGVERYVAVKVMHAHLADSADFQARFQREAKAVGQLQHPHIMRLIDFDSTGEHPYMVMEFVPGGSLRDYLQEINGVVPEAEAIALTKQLADALRYAHGRGMVHRDIKPANVLFSSNQRRHAVLSDFGIARLVNDVQLTTSGTMLGTPAYMAPEIVKGESADARADLYSLAAMLYEMVTGRTPHTGDTPYAIMLKQANDPLPPPQEINPNISAGLVAFLQKGLEKEPKDRFQSAEEMIIALQQLDNSAAPAPRPVAKKTSAPKKQSNLMPLLGAIVGVVVIAGLTAFLLTRGGDENEVAALVAESPTAEVVPTETSVPPTDVPTVIPTEEPVAIVPTDAPTAIPTEEPTIAPEPTTISTFDFASAERLYICDVRLTQETISETESELRLRMAVDRMRLPAAETEYVAWVRYADDANSGDQFTFLDVVEIEDGRAAIDVAFLVQSAESPLRTLQQIIISEEPLDSDLLQPVGDILFDGSLNNDAARGFLDVYDNSQSAITQLQIAINHRNLMQGSLDAGDFDGARQHAEHVLNILAVDLHGDMDGNGRAENPGDDVGVRRYVEQANEYSENPILVTALTEATTQVDTAIEQGVKVFATDSADEAQPVSAELDAALQAAIAQMTTVRDRAQTMFTREMQPTDVEASVALLNNGSELLVIAPDLQVAPEGFVNVVWISQNGQFVNVGEIVGTQLRVALEESGVVESAEIRRVASDSIGDQPSGDPLFTGTLDPAHRDALNGWLLGDAPLLPNLLTQAALAEQHTQLMQESLDAGDLNSARQHAEHVINIMEGSDGNNFGDLDGNGRAENPGDDVGVQRYFVDAANLLPAPVNYEAALLTETVARQQTQMETIIGQALKLLATDSADEAQPFATAQLAAVAAFLDGEDGDGNAVVDAFAAEAGLRNMGAAIWQLGKVVLAP